MSLRIPHILKLVKRNEHSNKRRYCSVSKEVEPSALSDRQYFNLIKAARNNIKNLPIEIQTKQVERAIDYHISRGHLQSVVEFIYDPILIGIKTRTRVASDLIISYVKNNKIDKAKAELREALKINMPIPPHTIKEVLEAHVQESGLGNEEDKYWESLCLDFIPKHPICLQFIIQHLETGRYLDAYNSLSMLVSKRTRVPNQLKIEVLIHLAKEGYYQELKSMFEMTNSITREVALTILKSLSSNNSVYEQYLALIKEKYPDTLLDLDSEMQAFKSIYEDDMISYAQEGDIEKLKSTYDTFKLDDGMSRCISKVIDIYSKQGDVDNIKYWVDSHVWIGTEALGPIKELLSHYEKLDPKDVIHYFNRIESKIDEDLGILMIKFYFSINDIDSARSLLERFTFETGSFEILTTYLQQCTEKNEFREGIRSVTQVKSMRNEFSYGNFEALINLCIKFNPSLASRYLIEFSTQYNITGSINLYESVLSRLLSMNDFECIVTLFKHMELSNLPINSDHASTFIKALKSSEYIAETELSDDNMSISQEYIDKSTLDHLYATFEKWCLNKDDTLVRNMNLSSDPHVM